MEYAKLRERCVAAVTMEVPPFENRYVVGIVNPGVLDLEEFEGYEDILWMKARGTTTIQKLKPAYLEQLDSSVFGVEAPPASIELTMDNTILDDDRTVNSLDKYCDKVIILRALDPKAQDVEDGTGQMHTPASLPHRFSSLEGSPQSSSQSPPAGTARYPTPTRQPQQKQAFSRIVPSPSLVRSLKDVEPREEPAGASLLTPSVTASTPTALNRTEDTSRTSPDEIKPNIAKSAPFDGSYMQLIGKITEVEQLEGILRHALRQATILESALVPEAGNGYVDAWMTQIAQLRERAKRQRTVVGIVGNTGAGKSSIINALLEEENLVPTSCMRACTAVVTELAWNDNNDPARRYRAEIVFISREDWKKELDVLFSEIIEDDGRLSRDIANADSGAGIAYAKVRAVYPNLTKEKLERVSMDELLDRPHVAAHLSHTKRIISANAEVFFRSLQRYVDSRENDKEKCSKGKSVKKKASKVPEWWPLIKCVKIFVKADALSTGAILVDLPGVQDSNAARAAVADGYMKQCSGLWIVAPITRAVNDKAAKTLLGDQFKRQMKFDGMLSSVTFICSKTDDILVSEAVPALGLETVVEDVEVELEKLGREEDLAKAERVEAKEKFDELGEAYKEADVQRDVWTSLKADVLRGRKVHAPRFRQSRKRKLSTRSQQKSKKRTKEVNTDDSSSDDDFVSDLSDELDASDDEEVQICKPLTIAEVETKLGELQQTMQSTRQERKDLTVNIKSLKDKLDTIKADKKGLAEKKTAICIEARNHWSKAQIQEDYAMGIKDLDMECAEEENGDCFDPSLELRDYGEIARSLPVFCISSRAYQKLSGRFRKDGKTCGFNDILQTEVPQLQAHCLGMTVQRRITSCRMFLEGLTKILASMSLWSSDDGPAVLLSDDEREDERAYLDKRLQNLNGALGVLITESGKAVKGTFSEHVQSFYDRAVGTAVAAAAPMVEHWGASPADGGVHWGTYRAIVRRNGGPFTNAKGTFDFNKDLTVPFDKQISSGWENAFVRTLPTIFKNLAKGMFDTLQTFHDDMEERAKKRGLGTAGIVVMSQKVQLWEQSFGHKANDLIKLITSMQKEANRSITPVVAAEMDNGYELGQMERGTGCVRRMKDLMEAHIVTAAEVMYKKSTVILDKHLEHMRSKVDDEMIRFQAELFEEIGKDYRSVILGTQLDKNNLTPKEQQMRAELHEKIHIASDLFMRLAIDTTAIPAAEESVEEEPQSATEMIPNEQHDEQDADAILLQRWLDGYEDEVGDENVMMGNGVDPGATGDASDAGASMASTADDIKMEY